MNGPAAPSVAVNCAMSTRIIDIDAGSVGCDHVATSKPSDEGEDAGSLGSGGVSGGVSGGQADGGSDDSSPLIPSATVSEFEEPQVNNNATTSCETLIHLLKGNVGSGILAMPDAIKNAGLLVGILGLQLIGAIAIHCMHMLVASSKVLARETGARRLDYSQVAEAAFRLGPRPLRCLAPSARRLVNVFLCLTQIGFCCVYVVFVATNVKQVVDEYVPVHLSVAVYMALACVPWVFLCWIRDLKLLAPFSMVANGLIVAGLVITFVYLLKDLPPVSERKAFASWPQLPLYFGTAIYAFEGIGVVLPLENEMAEPGEFAGWNGVLNTGMMLVMCMYTAVGFFGYLKYGDSVRGSVTLNLPQHDHLAQVVRLSMAGAVFLSYMLMFYVPCRVLIPLATDRLTSERSIWWADYGIRTGLVLLTYVMAWLVPDLSAAISLVGAVSSSTLAVVLPPLIDLLVLVPRGQYGPFYWRPLKNALLLAFGLVGFCSGTWASVNQILERSAGHASSTHSGAAL